MRIGTVRAPYVVAFLPILAPSPDLLWLLQTNLQLVFADIIYDCKCRSPRWEANSAHPSPLAGFEASHRGEEREGKGEEGSGKEKERKGWEKKHLSPKKILFTP